MREWPVSERMLGARQLQADVQFEQQDHERKGGECVQNDGVNRGFRRWSCRRRTVLQANDTKMTARSLIARLVQQEDLNFLLTNRIPRSLLTRFDGSLEPGRAALGLQAPASPCGGCSRIST